MAGVVSGVRLEDAGKWINQGAGSEVTLGRTLKVEVSIGASHTQMIEVAPWLATKAAAVGLFSPVGMLHPRLANLFEAIVVA